MSQKKWERAASPVRGAARGDIVRTSFGYFVMRIGTVSLCSPTTSRP